MAKPRTTEKTKTVIGHRIKTYNFFLVLAVLLGMIAGVLMVRALYRGEPIAADQPSVNLGTLEYDLSSGKAVKRDTPLVTSLRTFLNESASKDCNAMHRFMEPTQYTVVAATKDMKQVLLGYGCGDMSVRMFAVYKDDTWKFLSPTNQFDITTNAPLCSHVQQNDIKKEIAPVCFTQTGSKIIYHVR